MSRHPGTDYKNRNEPQVELESQFILRLPLVCFLYRYFIIPLELNLIWKAYRRIASQRLHFKSISFKEPARVLREALRNNLPLKDRLSIKLENDMRYGEVRVDHWLLHAKVNLIVILCN